MPGGQASVSTPQIALQRSRPREAPVRAPAEGPSTEPRVLPSLVRHVLVTLAVAVLIRLAYGVPSTSPDGLHSLVWGAALARGDLPSYDLGPTPHPLGIAAAAVLHLVAGSHVLEVANHLALLNWAVILVLTFHVGRSFGGPLAGAASALLAATSTGYVVLVLGASQDLAGITLLLTALLLVLRGGSSVSISAVLFLAGLLRPEYWLMAGLYGLWCLVRQGRALPSQWLLIVAAPFLWCLTDLVVTGNPLHSLLYTRDLAAELGRTTGVLNAPEAYVRGHGLLAGPAVVLAAPVGLWLVLRRRCHGTYELVGVLAVGALSYLLIGIAGLSLIERYALASSVVMTVLAGTAAAACIGVVRARGAGGTRAAAIAVLLALVVGHALRAEAIPGAREAIQERALVLQSLEQWDAELRACAPVHLPALRSVVPPVLALLLGRDLDAVPLAQEGRARPGSYLELRDPERFRLGVDLVPPPPAPPAQVLAVNEVWTLWGVGCPATS